MRPKGGLRTPRRLGTSPRRAAHPPGVDSGRGRRQPRGLALLGITIVLILLGSAPASAQTDEDLEAGRQVYEQTCQSCHQPGGVGLADTFPPLVANPNLEDADYVRSVIVGGLDGEIVVLGETYNGQMPAFSQLSASEVDALIVYVQSLAGSVEPTPPTTLATGPVGGDAERGEALFSGSTRFANGGPGCFACHAAGDLSQGGAGLGPDLTNALTRLGGEPGLTAWLSSPPSATMQPIFDERPLTESEIADLVAHFATTESNESSRVVDSFLLGGLGGLVALFVFMAFVLRGPRPTYAERLRSER